MKRKSIFIYFIIVLCFPLLKAQVYRVNYQMVYKPDSTKNETVKRNMILDVKNDLSKFYSYNLYKIDSMNTTGSNIRKRFPDYDFMVITDKKNRKVEKYFIIGLDMYSLKEELPAFNWEIKNEMKTVNNMNCQKAVLNYKGRLWEAWFTKDILFQQGPYVFNGLPGLIVEMKDSKNNYSFIMTGLKKEIGMADFEKEAISVTKEQLVKKNLDYYNDPYKELKTGKAVMKVVDESGNETKPSFKQLTEFKQKEIKNKNNPIEITEAIHYP